MLLSVNKRGILQHVIEDIYFAGSIQAGRNDAHMYAKIAWDTQKFYRSTFKSETVTRLNVVNDYLMCIQETREQQGRILFRGNPCSGDSMEKSVA